MKAFLPYHFNLIVIIWIGFALLIFPLLLHVRAPYGRHASKNWGPLIGNRTGWFIMELPSLALITLLFLTGINLNNISAWVFFLLWFIHYFNRIFIYPFRTRTRGKKIPVLVVILAMIFNLVNGFLNGYWLGYIAGGRGQGAWSRGQGAWSRGHIRAIEIAAEQDLILSLLTDPRFIIGLIFFLTGFVINQISDNHLIHLRSRKKSGYSTPTHALFRKISCPNFLGEILEWTGFAIMTWSLPALSFAVWTAVNLIPRAIHHHAWYLETFPDYPKKRKAIIPGIL